MPTEAEVLNYIKQLNVDAEIGKMLDAFYVNDQAELRFFSDIKGTPAPKSPLSGGIQPMDQNIIASSSNVDKFDDVNVIMANDQEVGMFDVNKSNLNSVIGSVSSTNQQQKRMSKGNQNSGDLVAIVDDQI